MLEGGEQREEEGNEGRRRRRRDVWGKMRVGEMVSLVEGVWREEVENEEEEGRSNRSANGSTGKRKMAKKSEKVIFFISSRITKVGGSL